MGMDDIRRPSQLFACLDRRAAEQGEPIQVVRIIARCVSIESRTIEERIVANADDRPFVALQRACLECHLDVVMTQRHPEPMRFAQRNRPVFQASIARQHEANLVAQPRQFNRKRADDIGETAGFGQWHRLAGEHEDLHVPVPLA